MEKNMVVLGIAGASGSGKSLLANTIVEELSSDKVCIISEDSYYKDLSHLPVEERALMNYDHPDSFDHDLFCEHLDMLAKGESIEVPIYDYVTHTRKPETRHVSAQNHVVVLEGILILSEPKLRERMDMMIFMDTEADICFIRRLQRDVAERGRTMSSVINQYQDTVRPMFQQFIEPSKRYADIIVPHGGKNRIAIEVLQAKLKELLA